MRPRFVSDVRAAAAALAELPKAVAAGWERGCFAGCPLRLQDKGKGGGWVEI